MSELFKPLIIIVGPSGSGKSSSLQNLDPETTYILDLERKGMPFRAKHFKHIIPVGNLVEFKNAHEIVKKDLSCSCLVIDSFTKLTEYIKDDAIAAFKGYELWNWYNATIKKILNGIKNPNHPVVLTAIDEIVKIAQPDGSELCQKRVKIQGKEHEGMVEKEFLITLFTDIFRPDKTKSVEYRFITNADGICSAKSPAYLKLPMYMPNDVNKILQIEKEIK